MGTEISMSADGMGEALKTAGDFIVKERRDAGTRAAVSESQLKDIQVDKAELELKRDQAHVPIDIRKAKLEADIAEEDLRKRRLENAMAELEYGERLLKLIEGQNPSQRLTIEQRLSLVARLEGPAKLLSDLARDPSLLSFTAGNVRTVLPPLPEQSNGHSDGTSGPVQI